MKLKSIACTCILVGAFASAIFAASASNRTLITDISFDSNWSGYTKITLADGTQYCINSSITDYNEIISAATIAMATELAVIIYYHDGCTFGYQCTKTVEAIKFGHL
jgi:hypothetical protein